MSTLLNSMTFTKIYLETLNMHGGAEIPQQYHLELFKCKKIICILTGYWIDLLQFLKMYLLDTIKKSYICLLRKNIICQIRV